MSVADTEVETRIKVKVPSLYKVVILNDDFTPMDFVISVFVSFFNKTTEEAYALTMEIHNQGKGVGGVYTKEVAEQKVADVMNAASTYGHPLRAVMEQA